MPEYFVPSSRIAQRPNWGLENFWYSRTDCHARMLLSFRQRLSDLRWSMGRFETWRNWADNWDTDLTNWRIQDIIAKSSCSIIYAKNEFSNNAFEHYFEPIWTILPNSCVYRCITNMFFHSNYHGFCMTMYDGHLNLHLNFTCSFGILLFEQ